MYKVENKEDAMEFFISNTEGSVMCIDRERGLEKVCDCYPNAEKFYESGD